jgi:NAD(P)H dehydrogenase (quinone)
MEQKMNIKIAVVYHSGYGHTKKVAEHIAKGARGAGAVDLINTDSLDESGWKKLDEANAIIFGAPTYMGSISAKFKLFIEESSKRWMTHKWKDKIAAGFTNSGSPSGDKLSSLNQLYINAMQHGMIWVSQGELPPSKGERKTTDINRLGSFSGLMTQANQDESAETAPPKGDLDTAELFGLRVATIAARFG